MTAIAVLINQALNEIGFAGFDGIANNTQTEAKQVLALANRELNNLQKEYWQELKSLYVITMTQATDYPLPEDYRMFIPDTAWATDQERKADFPVNNETWAYLKARDVATGLTYRVRIAADRVEIHNPEPGLEFPIEYISKWAATDANDNPKERFTADDDKFRLNDDLMIMGIKWRFAKSKGLDWQEDFADYKRMVRSELASNKNSQTLRFAAASQYPPFPPQTDLYLRP